MHWKPTSVLPGAGATLQTIQRATGGPWKKRQKRRRTSKRHTIKQVGFQEQFQRSSSALSQPGCLKESATRSSIVSWTQAANTNRSMWLFMRPIWPHSQLQPSTKSAAPHLKAVSTTGPVPLPPPAHLCSWGVHMLPGRGCWPPGPLTPVAALPARPALRLLPAAAAGRRAGRLVGGAGRVQRVRWLWAGPAPPPPVPLPASGRRAWWATAQGRGRRICICDGRRNWGVGMGWV